MELARLSDADVQRVIAKAVLEEGLQTGEVRQVAQLRRRTGSSIEACLKQVLAMRPTVERRYVFVGAVGDESLQVALAKMTQSERDQLLFSGVQSFGIQGTTGRLGENLFTLAGDKRLQDALAGYGKKTLEARFRAYIAGKVSDVQLNG